jgi:hypothetical protein
VTRHVGTAAARSTSRSSSSTAACSRSSSASLYTLRFVLRRHEIAVEPFLYIGLIAVVRRMAIAVFLVRRSRGPISAVVAPGGQSVP